MNAIRVRWWMFVMLAGCVLAGNAWAQAGPTNTLQGVYDGTYAGDQAPVNFKLAVTLANTSLKGVLTFYPLGNSGTNAYTCELTGTYNPASRRFQMHVSRWETALPSGVGMMGMSGVFEPGSDAKSGQISGKMLARDEPVFEAGRDAAESIKLAKQIAAQKAADAAAVNVSPAIPFQAGAPARVHGAGN